MHTGEPMTIRLKDAAKRIGRHHLTLRRWIKDGRMPEPHHINPAKLRSPLVFDLDQFEAFVKEQTARGFLRPTGRVK